MEHFFERVGVELNGGLPAGRDAHAQLLRRVTRAVEGVRPAVIDEPLRARLHEDLRFRHLFRHGYGFALEWPRPVPLLQACSDGCRTAASARRLRHRRGRPGGPSRVVAARGGR